MLDLYLDADACPVKAEAYRLAARHQMATFVVTCQPMRDPGLGHVTMALVEKGPDFADDWIAERIGAGDVCVTDDIPLASRCVKAGAVVVTPRGRLLHKDNMGEALATRDLLEHLRGNQTLSDCGGGGPAPFTKRDRSRFLDQLEQAVRTILKTKPASRSLE